MRIQNQIIVEWSLIKDYDDVTFSERLGQAVKMQNEFIKEEEALQIHQVTYVGEFNKEKKYIIILNIIPKEIR